MESNLKITNQNGQQNFLSQNGAHAFTVGALVAIILIAGFSAQAGTERASGAYSSARGFFVPQAGVKTKKRMKKPQTRVVFNDDEAVQFEVVEKNGQPEVVMVKNTTRGSAELRASL